MANTKVAGYMKAMNEAEHQKKSQCGELIKTKEKIVKLERELRAEKGRTARLEVSLVRARIESRCENKMEARRKMPFK